MFRFILKEYNTKKPIISKLLKKALDRETFTDFHVDLTKQWPFGQVWELLDIKLLQNFKSWVWPQENFIKGIKKNKN